MVLPLGALWFVALILILALFCTAYLMSARVFWALIIVVIAVWVVLTAVSAINLRRRRRAEDTRDEGILLDYLRSHEFKVGLPDLTKSLGFSQDRTLKLLLSLEKKDAIPAGSARSIGTGAPQQKPASVVTWLRNVFYTEFVSVLMKLRRQ